MVFSVSQIRIAIAMAARDVSVVTLTYSGKSNRLFLAIGCSDKKIQKASVESATVALTLLRILCMSELLTISAQRKLNI